MIRIGVIAATVMVVFSCAIEVDKKGGTPSWPPLSVQAEASANLEKNLVMMNSLATRITDSPYELVWLHGANGVEGIRIGSETNEEEIVEDQDTWRSLIESVGLTSVLTFEDDIHFINLALEEKVVADTHHSYSYIRSKSHAASQCLPEYSEFKCGQCDAQWNEAWIIQYAWSPSNIPNMSEVEGDQCIAEFIAARNELKGLQSN